MNAERFIIINGPDDEAEYLTYDNEKLSNFALDVAHELTYSLVEGSDVEEVEITLRWKGSY